MKVSKSISILHFCFLMVCASAAQADYIDNLDGTVTDTGTGLMWQQATAPGTYTWEQALAYCENLALAGYTDWRLPTAKELASIADITRYNPAINTTFFPDTVASDYWSSTTYASGSLMSAWEVIFNYGGVSSNGKPHHYYVRAVRSGQSGSFDKLTLWPVPDTGQTKCYDNTTEIACPQPGQAFYGQDASYSINTPAYTKLAAGSTPLPDNAATWAMVRDEVTGLIWEKKHAQDGIENYTDPNDADNRYFWYDETTGTPGDGTDTEDFINALNTSSYGGYPDWRMPTLAELASIVDYGQHNPSINKTYFPDTVASYYWTSTTPAIATNYACDVMFYDGGMYISNKSDINYARAVRDGLSNLLISTSGTGAGTVASTDEKINCGSDCSETYASGTQVTLTATASGSTFTGWSGGGCSGTADCIVTVYGNVKVTAGFDVVPTTTTIQPTTTTTVSGSRCPAKKALGENNPILENLRTFRDCSLAHSAIGRKVIQIYYNNADSIDAALDRSPALRTCTMKALEIFAPMLGRKEE